jgi:hypothetical protein
VHVVYHPCFSPHSRGRGLYFLAFWACLSRASRGATLEHGMAWHGNASTCSSPSTHDDDDDDDDDDATQHCLSACAYVVDEEEEQEVEQEEEGEKGEDR